jgi:hypothetical protein
LGIRRKRLEALGPERNTTADQMVYLIDLASKFQRLVGLALTANHGADDAFEADPAMCIAPSVMSRMKTFTDDMDNFGHLYSFRTLDGPSLDNSSSVGSGDTGSSSEGDDESFCVRNEKDEEDIVDVLHPHRTLAYPCTGVIPWLSKVFLGNRGFELGTFTASILSTAMKKQCSKWTDLSMGMVSDVIVIVHKFVNAALTAVCKDRGVRDNLLSKLSDELIKRYQKANDNTKFLLKVENSDTPMTLNHYFNDILQKR